MASKHKNFVDKNQNYSWLKDILERYVNYTLGILNNNKSITIAMTFFYFLGLFSGFLLPQEITGDYLAMVPKNLKILTVVTSF